MSRRPTPLLVIVLLVFLTAVLGIVTNYLTDTNTASPPVLTFVQQWALPLFGVVLVLLLIVQAWAALAERPPKRHWNAKRPPYPGLEPFLEEDAAVFFGRDQEISKLLDRLQPTSRPQMHRFIAVVGPSGSGKSSLVRAGLLPHLKQQRRRWLIVPPFVPGDRPVVNLATSLAELLPRDRNALARRLNRGSEPLVELLAELRAAHAARTPLVILIIDQAEELTTLTSELDRRKFLELLRDALHEAPWLWVVATLGSEFLTDFLRTDTASLFQNAEVIGPLSRKVLFEVIQRPAAEAGLVFDPPTLVNEIVEDTGRGNALPLLAYTLHRLFLKVGRGGVVTTNDYRELGGVAGALSQQADRIMAKLQTDHADSPVLPTLLKLVALDETEPSRRRVHRGALNDVEHQIVEAFVAARLLTSDAAGDDATIEVAHEALFRHWAPLRQAIEARTDDLRRRAELERWALDWERSGRQNSYLLSGERLKAAQQWSAAVSDVVVEVPLVREFLNYSSRSNQDILLQLSETVAMRALASMEHDPEQSILLALAAIEECAPTPLAQQALLTALAAPCIRVIRGHDDALHIVAWSPDGSRLATASDDRTARVWDAVHGTQLAVFRGHRDWVTLVDWSPDGHRVITASRDGTARVWDTQQVTEQLALHGHDDAVWGVAWSPDGRLIATASDDQTVRVWDAGHGAELSILRGHEDAAWSVAWSSDGKRLATASRDRTVRVWDVERGTELIVIRGHADSVRTVAWSPNGRRLVTSSHDRTARVWDAASGTELINLRHAEAARAAAWSPDGHYVASASHDRTVRVWSVENGAELTVLRGHADWVEGVAWSPAGDRVVTASHDRTARVWDAVRGTELLVLEGHKEVVRAVAWSPGQRIVTASHDRTARVWDADHGTHLASLQGHEDAVRSIAWSPDGSRVVTASGDRTARMWDADHGTQLAVLCVHEEQVACVAWSSDCSRIVTSSRDHTARVWDATASLETLVAKARGRVFRELTEEERRRAMLPNGGQTQARTPESDEHGTSAPSRGA